MECQALISQNDKINSKCRLLHLCMTVHPFQSDRTGYAEKHTGSNKSCTLIKMAEDLPRVSSVLYGS